MLKNKKYIYAGYNRSVFEFSYTMISFRLPLIVSIKTRLSSVHLLQINAHIFSASLQYFPYYQHKILKTFAVLVYGHVYVIIYMVILKSQNKIDDFLMILA